MTFSEAMLAALVIAKKQRNRTKFTCILFFDLKKGFNTYESRDFLSLAKNKFSLRYEPIWYFDFKHCDIDTKAIPECHTLIAVTTEPIQTNEQF
jgi:hypothetical protein